MPRKYVLSLILVTILFFGGIFILVRFISGGNKNSQPKQPKTPQVQKVNKLSSDGQSVSYTVYGRLVGEEDRRAIRITITGSERKVEVLQGYDESVLKSDSFSNKSSAFNDFLLALEGANFTRRDTSIKVDDKGICPLGNRYVFEAQYNDNSKIRTFSTSCSAKNVSFKGERSTIDTLFKAQIPNYSGLTSNIQL